MSAAPSDALRALAAILRDEETPISAHVVEPGEAPTQGPLAAAGPGAAADPAEYALVVEAAHNVGEDLGTIPPGFHEEMIGRGLLGMRVLWFERTRRGGFKPPERWDEDAAAMTSTHDLPTVAGWWTGRDIDWTWRIGRSSAFASADEERAARAKERRRLWRAIGDGGRQPPKDQPGRAVTAAVAQAGRSRCALALIPTEDLLGVAEQPNLPGTVDEHPNWRRRLPGLAEEMLDAPEVKERVERLAAAREG